ncbi:protein adenylyltransferase SelO family protein [Sulfurimonas sp. HSL3-7]|uniref:protein adenylyltransferase SelO family protein n=1 Tax=Sulfonitrofixus jiaomeiensis TaxID=3131938 RepID=UPI0031F89061
METKKTPASNNEKLLKRWSQWLEKWHSCIDVTTAESRQKLSEQMKQVNPKYTLREWFLVPAYQAAEKGDYTIIKELQEVMTKPYDEQSKETEAKYYAKKPSQFFDIAGISHVSCSS